MSGILESNFSSSQSNEGNEIPQSDIQQLEYPVQIRSKRRKCQSGAQHVSEKVTKIICKKSVQEKCLEDELKRETKIEQVTTFERKQTILVASDTLNILADQACEKHGKRQQFTQILIGACNLIDGKTVVHVVPRIATEKQLLMFHNQEYIAFLRKHTGIDAVKRLLNMNKQNSTGNHDVSIFSSLNEHDAQLAERFNLVDDTPLVPLLYEAMLLTVGASLTAVECLKSGAGCAINWCGGRHHAQIDHASGFCAVNDIVIAILELLSEPYRFKRIMYIDIDLHHGDAVEQAFLGTSNVFTLSFHHHSVGFFPQTGGSVWELDDAGCKLQSHFNVPLPAGINDKTYTKLFDSITTELVRAIRPDAIVMVAGVDTLATDPYGIFNLTSSAIVHCITTVVELAFASQARLLLLGGGGYNDADSARTWCAATAAAAGILSKIPDTVPPSAQLPIFGPHFSMQTKQFSGRMQWGSADSLFAHTLHAKSLAAAICAARPLNAQEALYD